MPGLNRRNAAFMVGATALAITLSACGGPKLPDAEVPDISLAGLSFTEAGLFEQAFTLQLRLKNPNDFDIPVDGLDFALAVNEAPFAEGLSNEDFTLPASAEIIVPVEVRISTNDLIERVRAIGTGRRLSYELSGTADIGSWFSAPVPFDRAGKLALPDLPGLTTPEAPTG
jgi:LEA14-like dessication related protein